MKDQLLKGLLLCLPKEGKSKEGLSGQAYTTSMRDCSMRNHLLSEIRTRLEGYVKGLEFELDAREIEREIIKQ